MSKAQNVILITASTPRTLLSLGWSQAISPPRRSFGRARRDSTGGPKQPMHQIPARGGLNFDEEPFLAPWEVTQSCDLACKHCPSATFIPADFCLFMREMSAGLPWPRSTAKPPIFKALRDTSGLEGKCGACEYKEICGGSRARPRRRAAGSRALLHLPAAQHPPRASTPHCASRKWPVLW